MSCLRTTSLRHITVQIQGTLLLASHSRLWLLNAINEYRFGRWRGWIEKRYSGCHSLPQGRVSNVWLGSTFCQGPRKICWSHSGRIRASKDQRLGTSKYDWNMKSYLTRLTLVVPRNLRTLHHQQVSRRKPTATIIHQGPLPSPCTFGQTISASIAMKLHW